MTYHLLILKYRWSIRIARRHTRVDQIAHLGNHLKRYLSYEAFRLPRSHPIIKAAQWQQKQSPQVGVVKPAHAVRLMTNLNLVSLGQPPSELYP